MGMFDTVIVRCPLCNTKMEFQSKAGDCELNEYEVYEVPVVVAQDINGSTDWCPSCGKRIEIRVPFKIDTVCMTIV